MIDNDNKTMIVLKGKTNAPVREDDWEYFLNYGYDKYNDVDTTVKVKSADDGYGVDIISSIQDDANYHNFIAVNYGNIANEEVYGLGLQFTVWNHRGNLVPIITSEQGIGRTKQPTTFIVNQGYAGSGGDTYTTYAPSYTYVTNDKRGVTFNTSAVGFYDFTDKLSTKAVFWHKKEVQQTIIYGDSVKAIAGQHSLKIGTQDVLPEWVMDGAIVSL